MDDCVECQGCKKIWLTRQLDSTGPIKDVDADGNHTKDWAHCCPECFSTELKVVIRIPVCI